MDSVLGKNHIESIPHLQKKALGLGYFGGVVLVRGICRFEAQVKLETLLNGKEQNVSTGWRWGEVTISKISMVDGYR